MINDENKNNANRSDFGQSRFESAAKSIDSPMKDSSHHSQNKSNDHTSHDHHAKHHHDDKHHDTHHHHVMKASDRWPDFAAGIGRGGHSHHEPKVTPGPHHERIHIQHGSFPDARSSHDPIYDGSQDPVGYGLMDEIEDEEESE
jgi:hypothetical protein